MRILAITNQKGGVGKTTSTVNLGASLAKLGQRVLLIDLDPQGNATTGCGIAKSDDVPTVYELLLGDTTLDKAIQKTEFGFDILSANRDLAGAEIELIEIDGREQKLKEALATVSDRYDYVLIDCPPALNMLTVNALVASDSVMIPMQCEYYALEGLSDLVETLRKVRSNLNPDLEIEGLLRTMYSAQNTLTQQVSEELISHFGDKVYETIIPRNVRLAEAPSHGKPATAYDASSKGAQAYMALAEELLARHGKSAA